MDVLPLDMVIIHAIIHHHQVQVEHRPVVRVQCYRLRLAWGATQSRVGCT